VWQIEWRRREERERSRGGKRRDILNSEEDRTAISRAGLVGRFEGCVMHCLVFMLNVNIGKWPKYLISLEIAYLSSNKLFVIPF
jgi:hypothetical protein